MKLYPKKLRSVKDLQREKKRLLKQKRELDQEEIFSFNGVVGEAMSGGGGALGAIANLLPVSPLVSMGIKMAGRIFSRKKDKAETAANYYVAPVTGEIKKKTGKSTVMKIATELIGGYLKWKAAELSFKGAKAIIKKRQNSN